MLLASWWLRSQPIDGMRACTPPHPENERMSTLTRDHVKNGKSSSEPTINFQGQAVSFQGDMFFFGGVVISGNLALFTGATGHFLSETRPREGTSKRRKRWWLIYCICNSPNGDSSSPG